MSRAAASPEPAATGPTAQATVADEQAATEPALQVAWRAMQALVLDNERRKEVRDALDLSFAKTRALRRLAGGPMTLRDLAVCLGTDPPYATLLVDDLEARGLVERQVSPDDRRSKLVLVTPAGREQARRAQAILDRPPPGLSALSPDELEVLARLLTTALG